MVTSCLNVMASLRLYMPRRTTKYKYPSGSTSKLYFSITSLGMRGRMVDIENYGPGSG